MLSRTHAAPHTRWTPRGREALATRQGREPGQGPAAATGPSLSSADPRSTPSPPPVCPVRLLSTACRTRPRPAATARMSAATPEDTCFADGRAGWFRLMAGSHDHVTPSKDTVGPAWQSLGSRQSGASPPSTVGLLVWSFGGDLIMGKKHRS